MKFLKLTDPHNSPRYIRGDDISIIAPAPSGDPRSNSFVATAAGVSYVRETNIEILKLLGLDASGDLDLSVEQKVAHAIINITGET